jgi:hypothetical protein
MAIVQNPMTGNTRNSFGNAVFYERYGKGIMRSKPLDYKDPKTPGQLTCRSGFRSLVKLAQPVLSIINEAYAGTLTDMSPYNRFISLNSKGAYTGKPKVLDHTKVVFCEFDGSTVDNVVMTTTPKQGVHVVWNPNTTKSRELESYLTFILVNITTNEEHICKAIALRSAGVADFKVPDSWVGCMTALHIVTTDCSQLIRGLPTMIIKFKAGVDEASIIR